MDDQTYIKNNTRALSDPQYYTEMEDETLDDATSSKSIPIDKFGDKILVWQAICASGTINGNIYRIRSEYKNVLTPALFSGEIHLTLFIFLGPAQLLGDHRAK